MNILCRKCGLKLIFSVTNRLCSNQPKTVVKRFLPSSEKLQKIIDRRKEQSSVIVQRKKGTTVKVYAGKVIKQADEKKVEEEKVNKNYDQQASRFNPFNIQMLPENLFKQIFSKKTTILSNENIDRCKSLFVKHNLDYQKNQDRLKEVDLKLPELKNRDILEHFYIIAEEQVGIYRKIVSNFIEKDLPPMPDLDMWQLQAGWTRYKNGKWEIVDFPAEDGLVFDVEVCVTVSKYPVMATAASKTAWYGWVSPKLFDQSNDTDNIECLIPLDGKSSTGQAKKIVIGHNVSYDRARVKEQYFLKQTPSRFLDTMSLHICVSGITSYQRAALKSRKIDEEDEKWMTYGSLNSLVEVYKLYCKSDKPLAKDDRDIFVKGTLTDVRKNFHKLMEYCANDVKATFRVLKVLFPLFLERFPHPVTLAGMLEMNSAYLPVNSNWTRYIKDCETTYDDYNRESQFLLTRLADSACALMNGNEYKKDLWMWDQDWSVQSFKMRKEKKAKKKDDEKESQAKLSSNPSQKFHHLFTKERLIAKPPLLAGYPTWYRKLCKKPISDQWLPGPTQLSPSMKITPKLMRLTWEGYPLHHIPEKGWGFLVPFASETVNKDFPLQTLLKRCPLVTFKCKNTDLTTNFNILQETQENLARKEYYHKKIIDKTQVYNGSGVWCNHVIDDCCYFFKLPHKDGPTLNVGNPLAKDFITKFSESVLAGDEQATERTLHISRLLSYWRNNRDRIMNQMVVWTPDCYLSDSIKQDSRKFMYGAILPQVVVCGTLTRRAMEPTWMTASNAYEDRIGSELRGMVQAPPGYRIVGADVDSQELWIASVIGDAHNGGIHGSTPFGWMTLSGTKANKTDMHSLTAKAVGISRDHAKIINYARIYGAGQNFAERLLKQFNPSMSANEARSKSMKMFQMTKGLRVFRIKEEFVSEELPVRAYVKWEAYKIAKAYGKKLGEMFEKPTWIGGTESAMFNRLEEIAESGSPVTPFLKCCLTRALEPSRMPDERFLPTRVNWVVQSGAVDFLHIMLVCMRWLMKDEVRFLLSFHDEVRYLVREDLSYKAALALHLTNLFTRAYCSSALGVHDLPYSVAFFSSVEIDRVLRKESSHDCRTPSNSHGLADGYDIPLGESLDIHAVLEKLRGDVMF